MQDPKRKHFVKAIAVGTGFLIILTACCIVIFHPPHPRSWHTLQKGMTRTEVLTRLSSSDLRLIERDLEAPIGSPKETWGKNYWTGRWTIRCIYDRKEDSDYLRRVTVIYESNVFPRLLHRMRHYN